MSIARPPGAARRGLDGNQSECPADQDADADHVHDRSTTGDARVSITQSYQLYHALKANGVPVPFIAYPVAGHFPGDPVRSKDVMRRWVGWVDEHLRDGASSK
jgi:Prolyl oligopeptidase family